MRRKPPLVGQLEHFLCLWTDGSIVGWIWDQDAGMPLNGTTIVMSLSTRQRSTKLHHCIDKGQNTLGPPQLPGSEDRLPWHDDENIAVARSGSSAW